MPGSIYFKKWRLPASYANFYIANETVLVPLFDDPADQKALGILADLFPSRDVVGINAVICSLDWEVFTVLHSRNRFRYVSLYHAKPLRRRGFFLLIFNY